MISRRDFWRRLSADDGPATIMLVLLVSWRRVADHGGHDAADVLSVLFESLCTFATASATLQSRVSTTVYAAYWPGLTLGSTSIEQLARLTPVGISTPHLNIELVTVASLVPHEDGEPWLHLYQRAQRVLDAAVLRLPECERYPPLPGTWEEAIGE